MNLQYNFDLYITCIVNVYNTHSCIPVIFFNIMQKQFLFFYVKLHLLCIIHNFLILHLQNQRLT